MIEYVEIEDPREIRRINRRLANKLRKALPRTETRTVGNPGGSFKTRVHFGIGTGSRLYWVGRPSDNKKNLNNFFGHGIPREDANLNIDVQLNLPALEFSRMTGGVFLRHLNGNNVVIAHRGIATLGHGRISKAALFQKMRRFQKDVNTSKGIRQVLLISHLESSELVSDIDAFASALRRAAKAAKGHTETTAKPKNARESSRAFRLLPTKLKKYFSEFSGRYKVGGREAATVDRHHGEVVEAVKNAFVGSADKLKNQAIDLVVGTKTHILLFEVKTSVKTQSLFTAVGQLAVHSATVKKYYPSKTLVRVMVLPQRVKPIFCNMHELQIELLLYSRSRKGKVIFTDGKHLLNAN